MRLRTLVLTVAFTALALAFVPGATVSAFPECPEEVDDVDEGTCAQYDHYAYCAQQKPPFAGDSWGCLPNPFIG